MQRARLPFGLSGQIVGTTSGRLLSGPGCITYISAYETTGGAVATVDFYDGISNNGRLITRFTLTSGQSTSEGGGLHWQPIEEGIYISMVTGSVAGSIYCWVEHDCLAWLEAEQAFKDAEFAAVVAASKPES